MKALRICIFLILISGLSNILMAQEKFILNYKIGFWGGNRFVLKDSIRNTENLDFMNYFDAYPSMLQSVYENFGMSAHLWFRNNWEADVKIAMLDDCIPNNLNLTLQYYPKNHLGVSMGFYGVPMLMSYWYEYHMISKPGFHGAVGRGFEEHRLYEYGFFGGPALKLDKKWLHFLAKANVGLSTYAKIEESIQDKQINSNLLVQYDYKSRFNPFIFIFPELNLDIDLISFKRIKIGFRSHVNYYLSNRSIGYTRTTWEWEKTNPVVETIDNPKHQMQKLEFGFGVYFRDK